MAGARHDGTIVARSSRRSTRGRRRSIATWQSRPKAELVRFVIGAEGQVQPDVEGRIKGRGLWLECRRSAVEMARTKNLFARLGRRPAVVPADLAERVERAIEGQISEALGLAARAGRVKTRAATDGTGVLVSAPGVDCPAGWSGAAVSAPKIASVGGPAEVGPLWIEDGAFARRLLCLAGRLKDWRGDAVASAKGL